jgi:hypothetical protein
MKRMFVCFYNVTAKAALKFESEAWVLKKKEEQRLEAAQMKCLRHLLGITKLDKKKESMYWGGVGGTGAQNIVKEVCICVLRSLLLNKI